MGDVAEWSVSAGLAVSSRSSAPEPRPAPAPAATKHRPPLDTWHGTITAVAPIAPGVYRVLLDYQNLLFELRRSSYDEDPIHAGMTVEAIAVEPFSFVIHKAIAGHAVAHVATTEPGKLPVNSKVVFDPPAHFYEALERFRNQRAQGG